MSRSTPILRNLLLVVLVRLSQEKCASSIKIFQIGCAYGAIGLTYETKRAMFVSTSALRAGRQQQPSHGRRKTHPARKSAFGLIPPGTPDSGRYPPCLPNTKSLLPIRYRCIPTLGSSNSASAKRQQDAFTINGLQRTCTDAATFERCRW